MKPGHDSKAFRVFARHEESEQPTGWRAALVCEFQKRRGGGFYFDGGGSARRPGFSNLAREVLWADASRSFRLETAVLGFVALVCAWPIAVMIHEVYRLLK